MVRDLVDEIEARKEDRKVVLARMAEIDNEIVTGLLLKGSALAGQASMNRSAAKSARLRIRRHDKSSGRRSRYALTISMR